MKCIAYSPGYKYRLQREYQVNIGIRPPQAIITPYIVLSYVGDLWIRDGYAWDGPSGPTIDTKNFMRGSLVHDALYQLMREGHLPHAMYRNPADRLLQSICIEDGMSKVRAWLVYQAVKLFAEPFADPASAKAPTIAPDGCSES